MWSLVSECDYSCPGALHEMGCKDKVGVVVLLEDILDCGDALVARLPMEALRVWFTKSVRDSTT